VQTGAVSESYLALDQGMIMAAIANELGDDVLRRALVGPDVEEAIRPLMTIERFEAKPRPVIVKRYACPPGSTACSRAARL
jgi:hypothetical protein